ncbi:MAG: hypothetical protein LBQ56_01570 [Synergistaceae bacterium]|jgi:hypothetical protein|nr:hypothetical protein [Synergistaceae bacterium]
MLLLKGAKTAPDKIEEDETDNVKVTGSSGSGGFTSGSLGQAVLALGAVIIRKRLPRR